jgi:flagellar biogenesis protein FliO
VNRGFRAGILLILGLLLVISLPARGETKPPVKTSQAQSPSDESLESSPIFTGPGSAASSRPDQIAAPTGTFDVTRVLLALGGVLAIIFLLRFGAKRLIPGAAVHRASSSVKIVGRCPISPKQSLLVVQFGKRLVLVGDAGVNLNPLCEINDPDEVAGILAQARDESISVARRFESLFGRARTEFAGAPEPQSTETFDDSNEVKPDDPSLQDTQKEISELRAKMRDVARQIGSA